MTPTIDTQRNLDLLYAQSAYRFPRDFKPSIMGLNVLSDETYRRQICAGAAWLDKNPGIDINGPEAAAFVRSTYDEHSISSANAVLGHIAIVQEKGFDG